MVARNRPRSNSFRVIAVVIGLLWTVAAFPQAVLPVVRDSLKDSVTFSMPSPVSDGVLGARMQTNVRFLISTIDAKRTYWLSIFSNPQGSGIYDYEPERVGKWIESASFAWYYSKDATLKSKLDGFVSSVIAFQGADGYLGDYKPSSRWADWDVWNHKYMVIGLLSYYQFTGDTVSLRAARKIGDLLCATFGPGKRDILVAPLYGTLPSPSVSVAMNDLYRFTGNRAYLDFCTYIAGRLESAGFLPFWLSTTSLAGWKAYETFTNILGMLDLGRISGNRTYITGAEHAWEAIYNKCLYPIGTFSWHEEVPQDYNVDWLRADAPTVPVNVGESCVTYQWIMLNWNLFRATGNVRYAQEMERTLYNAVIGGQNPRDGRICYFTYMCGLKFWQDWASPSEPRVIARIPWYSAGLHNGNPVVNFYMPGTYQLPVATSSGTVSTSVTVATNYPIDGNATITLSPASAAQFTLKLRVPWWCSGYSATVNGQTFSGTAGRFLDITRTWQPGDRVDIAMNIFPRAVKYGYPGTYPGKVVVMRGPQVLTVSKSVTDSTAPSGWVGTQVFKIRGTRNGAPATMNLVPYADAGQAGDSIFVVLDSMTILGDTTSGATSVVGPRGCRAQSTVADRRTTYDLRGRILPGVRRQQQISAGVYVTCGGTPRSGSVRVSIVGP